MTEKSATAVIGKTDVGTTLGIVWRDFPEMERRGGYSGPFNTMAEAVQCANDWASAYDVDIDIVHVENLGTLPEMQR